MNDSYFDEFTKAVAASSSRRAMLKTISRSATVAAMTLLGVGGGDAKGSEHEARRHKKCPPGTFQCGRMCCDASGDVACVNGTCCVPPHCPA